MRMKSTVLILLNRDLDFIYAVIVKKNCTPSIQFIRRNIIIRVVLLGVFSFISFHGKQKTDLFLYESVQ